MSPLSNVALTRAVMGLERLQRMDVVSCMCCAPPVELTVMGVYVVSPSNEVAVNRDLRAGQNAGLPGNIDC